MNSLPVIANASPLIALAQIDRLELLHRFFQDVVIPPAVVQEITPTVRLPAWIEQRAVAGGIGPRILGASLGPGESEVISLALEIGARWVILDERPGRRLAQALNLPVIGTLGILLAGKRRGFVPAVKPYLDALLEHGFRIAPALYEQVIRDAGEV